MLLKIHSDNPNVREVDTVVQLLQNGGVAICPTDTVYAYICAIASKKAYERLLQMRGVKEKDANFSLMLPDLSTAAEYVKIDNQMYRTLKSNLPGPFTFILNPSGRVPDKLLNRRKSIGIRIPDNRIVMALLNRLGSPLITSSIKSGDDIAEYETDPEALHENYGKLVDVVIDGGFGGNEPSTIVNCTAKPYELVRQGKGELV
jgi:tRNA threonylcarbamoyl adenosine modification protein (Sua5/YciO/YrdC/YwlC family)